MIGLASFALVLNVLGLDYRIAHVGLSSTLLILTYFIFMRILYVAETSQFDDNHPRNTKLLKIAIARFTISAIVVIASGFTCPF
ncbi:MAG: hypothetical protein R3A45_03235 [Bdellovibrionota bacterium]